jgi:hypothetical protein
MLVVVLDTELTASVLTCGEDTVTWLADVALATFTAAGCGTWVSSLGVTVA